MKFSERNFLKTVCFGVVLSLLSAPTNALAASMDLYSQSTYLPKIQDVVTDHHIHYTAKKFNDSLKAYLGVALSQDSRSNGSVTWNDNHLSPLIGLKLQSPAGPAAFFAEYRQTLRVTAHQSPQAFREADIRAGALAYQWWQLGWDDMEATPEVALFDESYGEAVFSSRLGQNVFFSGWSKLGLRNSFVRGFHLDGYLEGLASADRFGIDYGNLFHAAAGTRLSTRAGPVGAQIAARKFIFPNRDSQTASWDAQLSFSGEF